METTEKRELLIAFQQHYNVSAYEVIKTSAIDSFLSTLPDEGKKVQCNHIWKDVGYYCSGVMKCTKCDKIHKGIVTPKQSNPNPQWATTNIIIVNQSIKNKS